MLDKPLEMLKIDSTQVKSVRKAGLTMYASLSLGTQRSVRCPYSSGQTKLSVISGCP